jgi:hypothetical protein
MARVTGVKERLHSPLYDAFFLPETPDGQEPITFSSVMRDPSVIRFFVDVQNKTRLETNLQASGVLPSLNTFEARALRVVISGGAPVCDKDGVEQAPFPTGADPDAFIPELIYSSVITFLVGEKEAITAPTYMFPSGAGVLGGNGSMPLNHGEPDPLSTFRFSEPVTIECQQNFRVEMLFPRGVPELNVARAMGPRHIWVVLDGYLTRDVQ